MSTGSLPNSTPERRHVIGLAAQQIDLYRGQGLELVSHYNREVSALDGYRGRQLLELLQNADDAGVDAESGCKLLLDLSRDRLIVANTGKPFNRKGLTSLVISDCSPKQLERNRFIGSKGLGFRSVLTWTDRPLISSGGYEVVFDRAKAVEKVQRLAAEHGELNNEVVAPFVESIGRWPAAVMRFPGLPLNDAPWLGLARAYRADGYDTAIILPLPDGQRGDNVYAEMLEQIKDLPTSSLLFCRHLTRVEITGDLRKTWDLLRENHADGHATVFLEQDGLRELWDVYRQVGQVSAEAAEKSSGGRRDFEVAVAVPDVVKPNPAGSLCVFFPTHERLPCAMVMHATLETSDDRNRLVAHASNREVLGHLALHVAAVVESQATPAMPRRALDLIAGIEDADPELKALGFVDALVKACAGRSIFPRLDGTLKPSADVRQAPHQTWLAQLGPDLFPEVLSVSPTDPLSGLLALFKLSWFDPTTLRDRLKHYLLGMERSKAGEILGRLLADGQLGEVGADGLLVSADGQLIDGSCFFTPVERLPTLPSWALNIRFVDEAFQAGLLRGSGAPGLRFLASDLTRLRAEVDEYRFDTVARALIDQIEEGLEGDALAVKQRWAELLRWLLDAAAGSRQLLPQLAIKVITTRGTLRRATTCYLGPEYPRGQIVWRLYGNFEQDEFVAQPSENGLDGVPIEEAEEFLLSLGVNAAPRPEAFDYSSDYRRFLKTVVDRLDYPQTVRGRLCHSADEVRAWCTHYDIDGIRLPDRWLRLLNEGDPVTIVAYLLSSGATVLAEEIDPQAKFKATIESERTCRPDTSIPIPNASLFFLRETAWVPTTDGQRRRPSEIMLSSQGVRVLSGVYSQHALNWKDQLISAHGGRGAFESLLTRLGAVSSLDTLSGQSLYELLLSLPERDPKGELAPRIYRTLVESSVNVEDSPHREGFLKSGNMWGRYKGEASYIPVSQLRYNANLTVTKAIETHIPLVDVPRRKNTQLVKQLFGILPLTSEEIKLTVDAEGTEYDPASEDANRHLHIARPYIYALRLAETLDEQNRDLGLLRKAVLRVCHQARVLARLPGGATETIVLNEPGERIVVDSSLLVVGEYREEGHGFLTFWLSVAELVAELLGRDVAGEVGGILRCRTPAEMQEVLRVRLGADAEEKLSEARSRFEDSIIGSEGQEELILPLQPSGPAASAQQPALSQSVAPGSPVISGPGGGGPPPGSKVIVTPIVGPVERPTRRRKLVVTGPVSRGGGGRGPLATEDKTFKVVEAFERHEGRFTILVSHLHGSDTFGCDLLSVAAEAIRDKAMAEKSISDADIMRYIEVKGRSARTGEVELGDNQLRAAERLRERYWLYRVFVDPNRDSYYEVALLPDPLNSRAVRTVTRFNLAEGSGASSYSVTEMSEEEPRA